LCREHGITRPTHAQRSDGEYDTSIEPCLRIKSVERVCNLCRQHQIRAESTFENGCLRALQKTCSGYAPNPKFYTVRPGRRAFECSRAYCCCHLDVRSRDKKRIRTGREVDRESEASLRERDRNTRQKCKPTVCQKARHPGGYKCSKVRDSYIYAHTHTRSSRWIQ